MAGIFEISQLFCLVQGGLDILDDLKLYPCLAGSSRMRYLRAGRLQTCGCIMKYFCAHSTATRACTTAHNAVPSLATSALSLLQLRPLQVTVAACTNNKAFARAYITIYIHSACTLRVDARTQV